MQTHQKALEFKAFFNVMKELEAKKIIEALQANPKVLETVAKWIMANNHDKKFKKCKLQMVDNCEGVGLASQFHGRRCRTCTREFYRIDRIMRRNRKKAAKAAKANKCHDISSDEFSDSMSRQQKRRIELKKLFTEEFYDESKDESSDESSEESSEESSDSDCEKTKKWKRRSRK